MPRAFDLVTRARGRAGGVAMGASGSVGCNGAFFEGPIVFASAPLGPAHKVERRDR